MSSIVIKYRTKGTFQSQYQSTSQTLRSQPFVKSLGILLGRGKSYGGISHELMAMMIEEELRRFKENQANMVNRQAAKMQLALIESRLRQQQELEDIIYNEDEEILSLL